MSPRVPVLSVLLCLVLAAPAAATTFYAAPRSAGTGDCASAANPCSFSTAVSSATNPADVVVLAGGDYPEITTSFQQFSNFTLRGASSWDRPTLNFSGNGQLRLEASDVQDVDFNSTAVGLAPLRGNGGTLQRLRIKSVAANALGLEFYNGIVRDSTIIATGSSARGIQTLPSGSVVSETLRNVTVLTSGGTDIALDIGNNGGGTTTATVVNGIFRGTTGIAATAPGATATVDADHSNVSSSTTSGGGIVNSTNPVAGTPAYINQGENDLRPAVGSVAIDAGTNTGVLGSEQDVFGRARTNGTTDIGGFEFYPPITGSTITSPAGGSFSNPDLDTGSIHVAGTTAGGTDSVDIICGYGSTSFLALGHVPVAGDATAGVFSADVPASRFTTDFICKWRAVPAGATSPFTGFAPSTFAIDGYLLVGAGGANPGVIDDFAQYTAQPEGYSQINSAGNCLLAGSYAVDPTSLVYSVDPLLSCLDPQTAPNVSALVDDTATYLPFRAVLLAPAATNLPGITGLTRSVDATTGDVTTSWHEATGTCTGCVAWTTGPFTVDTSASTSQAGRIVKTVQVWTNGDSVSHDLKVYERLRIATPVPVWKFPGDAAFATHAASDSAAFSSAPASVQFISAAGATDGAFDQSRGSLTLRPKPDASTFLSEKVAEVRFERTVPAGGQLRIVMTYTQSFNQADVDADVLTAAAGMTPSVAFTGPTTGSGTTVTGTTSDPAGGLPAVTVNGIPATVANDGTWAATVALAAGDNALSAVASIDGAQGIATRTFTYQPPGTGGGGGLPGGGSNPPPTITPFGFAGAVKILTDGVRVGVNIPGAGTLTGTLTLLGKARAAAKNKPLVLGGTRAKVTTAGKFTLPIKLTKTGKALLEKKRKLKTKLAITFKPVAGKTQTRSRAVTLRAKKKH